MSNNDELYIKLRSGPAVLFLGQRYLRLESGKDFFLSEILRKYGKDAEPYHYSLILEGDARRSIDSSLAWMQERCERLSVPQWLKTVSSFQWNSIYTSAIDTVMLNTLRSEWRELQLLFEEKYRPLDIRNRTRLHCSFLFGCVNRGEEAERPPLTKFEWLKRKQVAISLARRLPEIVTPFGVLIIEGYDGENDWLSPEDLFPIIDQFSPGQTHVFSSTEEIVKNVYLSELSNIGKVIFHRESLSHYLLMGEEAGYLRLGVQPDEEGLGRRIRIGETFVTVPSHIWNQVSKSVMILDDTLFAPASALSTERRYGEFRNFLSESSVRPVWSGYQRGFAFTRNFEKRLKEEVDKRLRSKELQNEPIVVHGQTGTGKTVALGALAYNIRRENKYPVVFLERRSQRPITSDIDTFCKWAEDNGATASLIVWDGMIDFDQYYDMVQYLSARGRKIILVGSSYREEKAPLKTNFIEAPAILSSLEIDAFKDFLLRFDEKLFDLVEKNITTGEATFLVALYRLLPPTRSSISSGVSKEMGFAEQEILRTIQESTLEPFVGTVGYALWKAELVSEEQLFSQNVRDIGGESLSDFQELTGLVMVPGQFGLRIPVELLLRAMGKEGFVNLVDLLRSSDIFRWYEDQTGNISIGPRHSLEAQLFVQTRLGGSKTEVSFAKTLLLEIHDSGDPAINPEIQFGIDLIRNMGPNRQRASSFAPYFQEISEILSALREDRGLENPRLMLQEATLLREVVFGQDKFGLASADGGALLDRAESILRKALDILGGDKRNRGLRGNLLVELGAVLGSKALSNGQQTVELFKEAREQLIRARSLEPESHYPIDVLFWTTRDLIRANALDSETRAEAEADLLHVFEVAETEDFNAIQKERFNSRRWELGQLIGDEDISEEAFLSLIKQGSSAGYYLKAHHMVGNLPFDDEVDDDLVESYRKAISYLENNRKAISGDKRCLYLLLRLWWIAHTNRPMFYKERQTLSFSREDWQYCLELILDLTSLDDMYANSSLRYIQGLCTFHLGNIESAFNLFRDLEREADYSQGRRRVIRSYLASTALGRPQIFNGTVTWIEGNRGEIYVQELRRNVRFISLDFGRPDIRKYETLSGFHIAFNFIGPIVDPASYYKD